RHILLIEDDKDDQFLFAEALTELDPSIRLDLADHGMIGCEKLMKGDKLPDMIFLDLNMPKMDGFAFLKWYRSTTYFEKIPVIVFTTSNSAADRMFSVELGASNFITKPVNYLKVIEVIAECIAADWFKEA
ncbi:MAG: response regulator, partial [Bacteroidota bacterium]|nr:response regulator [Bacteroidota bacterium]